MSDGFDYDDFLSNSAKDKAVVRVIAERREQHKVGVHHGDDAPRNYSGATTFGIGPLISSTLQLTDSRIRADSLTSTPDFVPISTTNDQNRVDKKPASGSCRCGFWNNAVGGLATQTVTVLPGTAMG